MTDTARSAAALKALFSDNTTGEISAQDMRDFVESISSPAGIYNVSENMFVAHRFLFTGLTGGMYDTYTKAAKATIDPGEDRIVDWNGLPGESVRLLHDPQGWLNAAPVTDPGWWGTGDYPTGTILLLPAGVYIYGALVQLTADITSGSFSIYFDRVFNPADGDALTQLLAGIGDGLGSAGGHFGTSQGQWVCDEPTYVIPDVFASGIDAPKTPNRFRLFVTRVR